MVTLLMDRKVSSVELTISKSKHDCLESVGSCYQFNSSTALLEEKKLKENAVFGAIDIILSLNPSWAIGGSRTGGNIITD